MPSNRHADNVARMSSSQYPDCPAGLTDGAHQHTRINSEGSSSQNRGREANTPPSPPQSGPSAQTTFDDSAPTKSITIHEPHGLPYVQLDYHYTRNLTWSNDPNDLALETYFTSRLPNLGHDFNIEGLRPVVRELKGTARFIMKDQKGRYYVWDEWDTNMYWVRDGELESLPSDEKKVAWILSELGDLEVEAVYTDYHPADQANLATIRDGEPEYRI